MGFPLLIAPAYALGGPRGVELFLAAIAALAVALGYRLALRVAPDPWALGAALAVGLSPPLLAYGTAVYPELAAGGRARRRGAARGAAVEAGRGGRRPLLCFVLLGRAAVARHEVRGGGRGDRRRSPCAALWRARRRTLAVGAVEVALFSRGPVRGDQRGDLQRPHSYAAETAGRERHRRVLPRRLRSGGPTGSWRCSSTAATACSAGRRCSCSRSPGCGGCGGRAATGWRAPCPDVRDMELTAGLCAAALGAQLLVAAFLAPDHVRLLVPAAPSDGRPCRSRSRWWHGASGTRRGLGVVLVRADGGRVGRGSTPTCAGATARSWPTGRTPRSARSPTRCPLFSPGGGWPFWLAGAIGVAVGAIVLREALARAPLAPDRRRHAREVLRVAHERAAGRRGGDSGSAPRRPRSRSPRARA